MTPFKLYKYVLNYIHMYKKSNSHQVTGFSVTALLKGREKELQFFFFKFCDRYLHSILILCKINFRKKIYHITFFFLSYPK